VIQLPKCENGMQCRSWGAHTRSAARRPGAATAAIKGGATRVLQGGRSFGLVASGRWALPAILIGCSFDAQLRGLIFGLAAFEN